MLSVGEGRKLSLWTYKFYVFRTTTGFFGETHSNWGKQLYIAALGLRELKHVTISWFTGPASIDSLLSQQAVQAAVRQLRIPFKRKSKK